MLAIPPRPQSSTAPEAPPSHCSKNLREQVRVGLCDMNLYIKARQHCFDTLCGCLGDELLQILEEAAARTVPKKLPHHPAGELHKGSKAGSLLE
jgi:hypothetical protein